ncbi:MAG: hypothetical protein A2Y28_02385 [Chlamydiae bacterium GWC2_50_10]|nr:MAG: hypothetical protein A2Z85_01900 [Chlamydiae bacterium GWA2_50_15]OGN54862.1 MAG: hypothetical protein A2Y28_02385 [Chlamydiae bacterium GWC2_50_10]OGN55108.1 MAG: hypothetical protein A2098_01745 [Chlamydiae bacterium GWF2_49_8]OGN58429.1 MAG: hypothetical protein A3D18_00855 [Chlamydiae bacterium RIFCSPHIGHO2_02_FULL_49_29]OGN64459.1 MAG: hypothetical protein A3E26_03670 [Chlamydiae bacterium RIFCSPHIGHO2_12_FULL_49_32]OGN71342.1 MAG: hypothetical protein A3I15_03910 [Chlamydiae bact
MESNEEIVRLYQELVNDLILHLRENEAGLNESQRAQRANRGKKDVVNNPLSPIEPEFTGSKRESDALFDPVNSGDAGKKKGAPQAPLETTQRSSQSLKEPGAAPFSQTNFLLGAAALQEIAPHLLSKEPIPDDHLAKKIAGRWKEKREAHPVALLSFDQKSLSHRFLKNLKQAISLRLAPAHLVLAPLLEQEGSWDLFLASENLKLVLCFPIDFSSFPSLRSFYVEHPVTKSRSLAAVAHQDAKGSLKRTPLYFLRPFADYQTAPELKKALWKELCTLLVSPLSS